MNTDMKLCKGCNLNLPFSNFNTHTETKDGLRSKCIECRRLENIEYRQKNPEKMRLMQKECDRRKANKPGYLENKRSRNSKYSKSVGGKLRIRLSYLKRSKVKKFRVKPPKPLTPAGRIKRNKSIQNWRVNNRDKSNAIYALRRASKRNATPPWLTEQDKESMLELFIACQMFKLYTGQEYHVDHIVPLVNKNVCGLHIPCNLRITTAFENLSKSNKFDENIAIDYSASYYKVYAT